MSLTDMVIMPGADYQAACDAIREKTEGVGYIRSGDMAELIRGIETGVQLPVLTNPASASDIASGKEAIDGEGNVLTGTAASAVATFKIDATSYEGYVWVIYASGYGNYEDLYVEPGTVSETITVADPALIMLCCCTTKANMPRVDTSSDVSKPKEVKSGDFVDTSSGEDWPIKLYTLCGNTTFRIWRM